MTHQTGYLGAWGEAAAERVIEKSRFLGYCARTAGEEEAKAFLERIRSLHPAATHVCYGYIADPLGNLQRFSDAGEPQGTAGLPILGVLKAQKLCETSVAVVRYFGGIKLGAGGLTRAYANTAADAVAAAEKRSFEPCTELIFTVDYPEVTPLLRELSLRAVPVLSRDFSVRASVKVAVRAGEAEALSGAVISALNGRAACTMGSTYLHPFPV